jgi:hypothetical protein
MVVANPTDYALVSGGGNIAETIRHNMGGEQVTPGDLTRIRVPGAGATTWTVIDSSGDESGERTLEGILVHVARRRAFWASQVLSKSPPDCQSSDCVHGVGNPGGLCERCPNAAFGSQVRQDGAQGRGKACKESRLLFLVRPGKILPDVVVIPSGSLKPIRQYLLNLGMPYVSVVTRLTLDKVQNADGIAYAQVRAVKAATLDAETAAAIMGYAQELKSVFEATESDSNPDADEVF